jgi:hypothetical protein
MLTVMTAIFILLSIGILIAHALAIERGDLAAVDLDVVLVDFFPEIIQLGILSCSTSTYYDRGRPSVPSFQRYRRRFSASLSSTGLFRPRCEASCGGCDRRAESAAYIGDTRQQRALQHQWGWQG